MLVADVIDGDSVEALIARELQRTQRTEEAMFLPGCS
jgi:hypothetical protein